MKHRAPLEIISHLILGLPNEDKEKMLQSVKYVCDSGISGIKLHLLHILEGTDLNTLTPLEALSLLYELQKKARA